MYRVSQKKCLHSFLGYNLFIRLPKLTYDTFLESLGPCQCTGSPPRPLGHHKDGQEAQECPPTWVFIPIKTPKINQNPSWRTFLSFLIILVVTKRSRWTSCPLARSQGFQKGIICQFWKSNKWVIAQKRMNAFFLGHPVDRSKIGQLDLSNYTLFGILGTLPMDRKST